MDKSHALNIHFLFEKTRRTMVTNVSVFDIVFEIVFR